MMMTQFDTKAQEAIDSATLLLKRGWTNSAANRAYYDVFHAARAALIAAGISGPERAWSHKALQAAFSQLVRQRKAYPAHMASTLNYNREVREIADYQSQVVSLRSADAAVRRGQEFVGHIVKVMEK